MRHLHVEQIGGVSGDMFLGMLIALGADPAGIEGALERLVGPRLRLDVERVSSHGFDAVRVRVLVDGHPADDPASSDGRHLTPEASHGPRHDHDHTAPHDHHPHRSHAEIARMIQGSSLEARVRERALAVFQRLAVAEGRVHGVSPDEVHFHEVGAWDSIADIVGSAWAIESLGVATLTSSPFVFGRGVITMAHGRWPVPAPAAVVLAEGSPARFVDLEGETVTPTGAAIVTALGLVTVDTPPIMLRMTGAGAGRRAWPDRPNILRGFLGETDEATFVANDQVAVLECVIDDMSPQVAARLVAVLLEAGAIDAWIAPVTMKKGRPGWSLTVLGQAGQEGLLAPILFRESTTIGVRTRRESRWTLPRRLVTVQTSGGAVQVKLSRLPGGGWRVTPEFDDCLRVARDSGRPLLEIQEESRLAARALAGPGTGPP